jgi:hypothetical protein
VSAGGQHAGRRHVTAANTDGDSPYRQCDAIMRYAVGNGITIRACYWDAAVRGADPIETPTGVSMRLRLTVSV